MTEHSAVNGGGDARAIRRVNLNRLGAACRWDFIDFNGAQRRRDGIGLIEKLENLNTLVKTNGESGKREDKDGRSASSRLVWNVCVLVNQTWDRSSVRHLSIDGDERAADHLAQFLSVRPRVSFLALFSSICASLLHPCASIWNS